MGKSIHMPRSCQTAILTLQLISTFERQIFDFLGYMWLPILANFFNIIFVIFGLFGLYQYRVKYLVVYTVWMIVWLAYNVFIICFYLEVGQMNKKEDILSFGAGSFSWWLINSPGCRPLYNTTFAADFVVDENDVSPFRPSEVEGCYVRYEKIEVTHASIQLVLSLLGFVLCIFIIHYYLTVLNPKLEKQKVKAMYSIEYSPQNHDSNPNTLERETDLQLQDGEARAHMTPRRVKRRSYRNSTRNSKSMNRQTNRQSGRSARSSGRSHKSINPVTRLIDADQNRADSSTSNDAERYGQINPGFQMDNSRPNSIYNLSGPPTDIEASRPQSALTSYSNFHGQRRPGAQTAAGRGNITNLTQESLLNHEQAENTNMNMNASYDSLPPPPPPLSSSPTPQDDGIYESDNTSSIATAQLPVPQTRSSIRRNEYVNIPLKQDPGTQSYQEPEPQSPVLTSPPSSTAYSQPPVSNHQHSYANMPTDSRSGNMYGGARPRPSNPLYSDYTLEMETSRYSELDRSAGQTLSYEAETLRADTKLVQPGLYNEPYSLSDVPSQRSSQSEPNPPPPTFYNQISENQYGQKPLPQSPRGQINGHRGQRGQQSEIRGLHTEINSGGHHRPNNSEQFVGSRNNYNEQNGFKGGRSQGPPPPERRAPEKAPEEPYDPLRYDHDSGLQSMNSEFNSHTSHQGIEGKEGRQSMRRVPNGHAARDRVSLRMKQRRDMENKAAKPKNDQNQGQSGFTNGYDDYGYSKNGPSSLQNGHLTGPGSNGPSSMPNGGLNGHLEDSEDKWYMKDSMRPVGASAHGLSCKCYRCQRKLTAI